MGAGNGAPWVVAGVVAGVGFALGPADGAAAIEELVEDGRDQPGPAVDDLGVSAVSLAVTSFECEGAVWRTGFCAEVAVFATLEVAGV